MLPTAAKELCILVTVNMGDMDAIPRPGSDNYLRDN